MKQRFVVVAIVLSLSGCSGTAPKQPAGGSIRVAAAGGEGEIKAVEALADAFEAANAGTTVQMETVASASELIGKLTTQFLAGNPPDVFVMNYRRLGGFAARDVLEPVTATDTSALYPQTLSAFTFDGKLLCLPSNASSMVVYLNTALFASAGIALPKPGWTWDDMVTTARAFRGKSIKAIGFETSLIRLAPFVWSNGGEIVDAHDDPSVVDLSSPAAREAISFMLELQRSGMNATDRAAQDPEEAFTAGRVAMLLESRRAVPGFRNTTGLSFDVAPVPTKKTASSVLHSDGYCVTKASRNKALARAFAAFAVTGDGARILAERGRTVPALRSLAGSDAFLDPAREPKSSKVFTDQVANVRPMPHSPTWNEVEEAVEEILAQLFTGRLSIDEAIEEIATRTRRELAKA